MIVKRSIVISGVVTSISLETVFWDEIDRRAEVEGLAWQDYIRRLLEGIHNAPNRSSAVRETVLQMLREETNLYKKPRFESWWEVRDPKDVREIGTRGMRLFVGRQGPCDIVIEDEKVSRRHAMMTYDGQDWWVVDLESKNGLYFEGKKVPVARIRQGGSFQVGDSMIRYLGDQ